MTKNSFAGSLGRCTKSGKKKKQIRGIFLAQTEVCSFLWFQLNVYMNYEIQKVIQYGPKGKTFKSKPLKKLCFHAK